jgi:hypothetical protein
MAEKNTRKLVYDGDLYISLSSEDDNTINTQLKHYGKVKIYKEIRAIWGTSLAQYDYSFARYQIYADVSQEFRNLNITFNLFINEQLNSSNSSTFYNDSYIYLSMKDIPIPDLTGSSGSYTANITSALRNEDGSKFSFIDTLELNTLPRVADILLTAPDFNDEESPQITFSSGTYQSKKVTSIKAVISLDGTTEDIVRNISIGSSANSLIFDLTDAERQKLISSVTNGISKEITFKIINTSYNESNIKSYTSELKRTFTLLSAMPTISPVVEDGNTATAALTGDVNTFVKFHSQAVYAINAMTYKGATITHQEITCGNKSNTSPYGSIENVESGTFLFTVVDSRNLINSKVIEKNFINYVKLTSNLHKDDATPDGKLTFTINGNFFNGSFGAADNTLTLSYRYKLKNGSYSDWVGVMPILKDNTYSITITLTGLDYLQEYVFQVKAVDKLETIETPEYLISFTPVFDWSKEDFNFNIPVSYTEEGNSYSISEVAKKFDNLDFTRDDFKKVKGLFKAVSNRYELPVKYLGIGANYSNVDVSLYLYGNTIRGYITAQRKTAVNAGNIANEYVCQVEFDSGFKVIGFGAVSFASGSVGSVATFQMDETLIYPDDGSVSPEAVGRGRFDINLCAVESAGDEFNAYFTFPCLIDLTKY